VTQWRSVVGWPKYLISDDGQTIGPHGHVLKSRPDKDGYLRVNLYNGSRESMTTGKIHVLMLEAFVGSRPEGLLGLHRNGQNTDNRVENLYWGTPTENVADAIRHGTYRNGWSDRTHCKNQHEYTPENTRWLARGGRECRACRRDFDQRRWAASKKK